MEDTTNYRRAPEGFSRDQWDTLMDEGVLVIENALTDEEVDRYVSLIDEATEGDERYEQGKFFGPNHIVERYPAFSELIDHPRHVGFGYDIYGELLKLHISQFFIRPRDTSRNKWHPDGARAVPYGVFSPSLPMQIKIGYWLTDVPEPEMGNFVYLPGSHRTQVVEHYDTHDHAPGEHILCVKRGTMTIMHCDTWHRVEPNETDPCARISSWRIARPSSARPTVISVHPNGTTRSIANSESSCGHTIRATRARNRRRANFRCSSIERRAKRPMPIHWNTSLCIDGNG